MPFLAGRGIGTSESNQEMSVRCKREVDVGDNYWSHFMTVGFASLQRADNSISDLTKRPLAQATANKYV